MARNKVLRGFILICATCFVSLISVNSFAGSMRCGNKLVAEGDTKAEILLKCGEPMLKETIAIKEKTQHSEFSLKNSPVYAKHGLIKEDSAGNSGSATSVTTPIDQWTYDMGDGKFLRILIFEGGKLVAIEDGERS